MTSHSYVQSDCAAGGLTWVGRVSPAGASCRGEQLLDIRVRQTSEPLQIQSRNTEDVPDTIQIGCGETELPW